MLQVLPMLASSMFDLSKKIIPLKIWPLENNFTEAIGVSVWLIETLVVFLSSKWNEVLSMEDLLNLKFHRG